MNINFNFLFCHATSLFKESVLPFLTAQQKKILVVASIAFGLLSAYYLFGCCCFNATVKSSFPPEDKDGILDELDDVLGEEGKKIFNNKPNEAVSEEILKELKDEITNIFQSFEWGAEVRAVSLPINDFQNEAEFYLAYSHRLLEQFRNLQFSAI